MLKQNLIFILAAALLLAAVVPAMAGRQPTTSFSCTVAQMQVDYQDGQYVVVTCITSDREWRVYSCGSASIGRDSGQVVVSCYDLPSSPEPTLSPYPAPASAPRPVHKVIRNKD
jgi:hypothetical protein